MVVRGTLQNHSSKFKRPTPSITKKLTWESFCTMFFMYTNTILIAFQIVTAFEWGKLFCIIVFSENCGLMFMWMNKFGE